MARIKLPKKHLDALDTSLRQLYDLQPEIARAKAAGLDTTQHEEMHANLTNQLNLLKQHYGQKQQ